MYRLAPPRLPTNQHRFPATGSAVLGHRTLQLRLPRRRHIHPIRYPSALDTPPPRHLRRLCLPPCDRPQMHRRMLTPVFRHHTPLAKLTASSIPLLDPPPRPLRRLCLPPCDRSQMHRRMLTPVFRHHTPLAKLTASSIPVLDSPQ